MQHASNPQTNTHKKHKTAQKQSNADSIQHRDCKQKIDSLEEEIQDLESQILDMFEVAFHFAGLKEEHLHDALTYYMDIMESQDEDLPYNAKSIIANILLLKQDKPAWFQHTPKDTQ